MKCRELIFTGHAVRRMFQRKISKNEVTDAIITGEIIADYPNDEPYPSCLILGFVNKRPLHVVLAIESDSLRYHVITAYDPDPELWDNDFTKRITQ